MKIFILATSFALVSGLAQADDFVEKAHVIALDYTSAQLHLPKGALKIVHDDHWAGHSKLTVREASPADPEQTRACNVLIVRGVLDLETAYGTHCYQHSLKCIDFPYSSTCGTDW